MLRGKRGDRREERQQDRSFGSRGSGNTRYQMRQRLGTIGDDFWIENEAGQKVFKVDGKALRLRKTLKFEDMHGNELCQIQEKKARIKESMEIEDPNGEQLAMVKKALISPVRERFVAKLGNGPDLDIQGNFVDHEYTVEEGRNKIAEISKKWFRLRQPCHYPNRSSSVINKEFADLHLRSCTGRTGYTVPDELPGLRQYGFCHNDIYGHLSGKSNNTNLWKRNCLF